MKDVAYSDKEMDRQKQRIQEYDDDPERDASDVKKQGEVLKEYEEGQVDELKRLKTAMEKLQEFLVRAPRCARRNPPLCNARRRSRGELSTRRRPRSPLTVTAGRAGRRIPPRRMSQSCWRRTRRPRKKIP